MLRQLLVPFRLFILAALSTALGLSSTVNVGYISFDLTFPANVGEFDIVNATGPNSTPSPDPTFPITNSVSLSNLTLVVNFQTGPAITYGPASGYFTLDSDGLSFDGAPNFNIALDPITSAVLTGTYNTTVLTLNDGSMITVKPSFSVTITDPAGSLQDGDFGVLTASTTTTPEPAVWLLLSSALAVLFFVYRSDARKAISSAAAIAALLIIVPAVASASVRLNADTVPSTGVAGESQVSVTGSGFPGGTITPANVTVSFAATCGGAAVATTTALSVIPIIGSEEKVEFLVPGALSAGTYYVSIGSVIAPIFASGNCSALVVQVTAPVLSCTPGSSMGVLTPAAKAATVVPVTVYVPNGSWSYGTTGVQVVTLEGAGTATSVATADIINSCSTNSINGITVCTANGSSALVYLLTGTTVNAKIKSGSNTTSSFSGGACYNCGVAVNSVTNQAVITMGYSGAPSALQFLNLANNAFGAVVPTYKVVSEDVQWDPFLNDILSPNENRVYDVFQIKGGGLPGPAGTIGEYAMNVTTTGEPDSAGEDCSTGIALTGGEFSGDLVLIDLTQATFTEGAPGTWTAPTTYYNLAEFSTYLAAGSCPIAVAPGTTHLGAVGGEFGGNYIAAISLPTKSGPAAGAPKLVDYVVAPLPNTPDGNAFANGTDPHTVTAYTSPNTQKAYGVAASWSSGGYGNPTYIAVIDLAALLAAPRNPADAHLLASTVNLLTSGIVRYVKATP